jgi:hypothetical protein
MSVANTKKKICRRFPIEANGHFSNIQLVVHALCNFKPGISRKWANAIVSKYVYADSFSHSNTNGVLRWESENGLRHYATSSSAEKSRTESVLTNDNADKGRNPNATTIQQTAPSGSSLSPKQAQNDVIDEALEAWVHQQFLDFGFSDKGFKGWGKLTNNMCYVRGERKEDIITTVARYVSVPLSLMSKA